MVQRPAVPPNQASDERGRGFPTIAGVFLGLGLGGFFDGIVLHQILQWHHMVTSAGYPPDSVANLQFNTLLDGLFHTSTYIFVAIGLGLLWRAAHRTHIHWSTKMLIGTLLIGFGLFNLVEGVVNHHLLGLHHVNETVPQEQWISWDLGFLVWGAAMLASGWLLWRSGMHATGNIPVVAVAQPEKTLGNFANTAREREVGER